MWCSPVTATRTSTTKLQETEGKVEKKRVSVRWMNEEKTGGGDLITRRNDTE
jgi:hypothetical protein